METSVLLMLLAAISCLPADEANHRDVLLQWWDEDWGLLEDNSASAGFTGNEKSWRQTVNRCWPCVQRKRLWNHRTRSRSAQVTSVYLSVCVFSLRVRADLKVDGMWRSEIEELRNSYISIGNPVSYLPFMGSLGLHIKLQGRAKRHMLRVGESDWHDILRFIFFFKEKLLSVIYMCSEFRFLYEVLSAHVFMFTPFFFIETTKKSQKWKWKKQRNLCKCPGVNSRLQKWILHVTATVQTFFCHLFFGFSVSLFKINSHKCQSGHGWWSAKLAFKPQIGFRIMNEFLVIVSNIYFLKKQTFYLISWRWIVCTAGGKKEKIKRHFTNTLCSTIFISRTNMMNKWKTHSKVTFGCGKEGVWMIKGCVRVLIFL